VIRAGLRVLEAREEMRGLKLDALRAEIQRGIDSGPSVPAEKVFAQVRASLSAKKGQRPAKA